MGNQGIEVTKDSNYGTQMIFNRRSNNLEKQVRELLVKINEMTLSINRGNNGAENLY